jgi:signal transduction histidine kinase
VLLRLVCDPMENENLIRLVALIRNQRDDLLARWRRQVRQLPGAANLDTPTINDQVPELLDSLADSLQPMNEPGETNAISTEHGLLRWQAGFDVTEVVAEYNILRQCLQDAAEREGVTLSGRPLHIINDVFDDAIGKAVKAFETMMTIQLQHRHDEHLAFVLHDLRTPLEALSLATTLLERSLPDDKRNSAINSAVSVLRGNIDRLTQRVRRVLSTASGLGKSFHTEFRLLNLRAQVEKVVRDLEPLADSAGTTVRNQIDDQFEIYSDEVLIAQIFENLVSNALKFTFQGTIEIGAREAGDDQIECWVKDSGQGIPPSQIDKVFERFETGSEREQSGMGLGLAIVKEIIELHKSEIRVESEVGKGSTFWFKLPRKEFS